MNKIAIRITGIIIAIMLLPIAIVSAVVAVPLAVAIGVCKMIWDAIDAAIEKEKELEQWK